MTMLFHLVKLRLETFYNVQNCLAKFTQIEEIEEIEQQFIKNFSLITKKTNIGSYLQLRKDVLGKFLIFILIGKQMR